MREICSEFKAPADVIRFILLDTSPLKLDRDAE
jgi:hypothetical protein